MTDATRSDVDGGRAAAVMALLAGPLLIVASITVWAISDSLVTFGPFDRAQIGWVVVVPLFLFAPAAAALAARRAGRRTAVVVAVGIAMIPGGLTVLTLATTMTRIGCTPVSPYEAALYAIPVGLAAGLGFLAAVSAGLAALPRGAVAASVAAVSVGVAGGAVTLLVFGLNYPGVSCAYVPA